MPDVPQRLSKTVMKEETIEKMPTTEFENNVVTSFGKAIKYRVETYRNNDFVKKVMSSRVINYANQEKYTSEDDLWNMEIRRYLYDHFLELQEQNFLKVGNFDYFQNPKLLTKIDLQELITLYEKDLYDVINENEKGLTLLEEKVFRALEEEEIHKVAFDPTDCIVDLRLRFPEDDMYISYLERKQNESKDVIRTIPPDAHQGAGKSNNMNTTHPRIILEDMVCQICNDGDYTDDDLIVFCSVKDFFPLN